MDQEVDRGIKVIFAAPYQRALLVVAIVGFALSCFCFGAAFALWRYSL